MSNVTISICGRPYTIACDPGDERHVTTLGETVDAKIRDIGAAGQTEVRQLLFAALFLADEVLALKGNGASHAPASTGPGPAALEALADRLEKCAAALEG